MLNNTGKQRIRLFERLFSAFGVLGIAIVAGGNAEGQILDRVGRQIERKANDRLNRKIDQTIDKGFDKVEGTIDEGVKGGDKKAEKPSSQPENNRTAPAAEAEQTSHKSDTPVVTSEVLAEPAFAAYSKYDFIPGEKIIVFEDFSQDQIGDFPARWNTNASGEIVRIEGSDAKWLAFTSSGVLTPEFVTGLPENCTVEFDLAVNPGYSFYDQPLTVTLAQLKDPKEFVSWARFGRNRHNGVLFSFHPQGAGGGAQGLLGFEVWEGDKKVMDNSKPRFESFSKEKNRVRVSIWRQKQRVRLYVNEVKVWDLPRVFVNEVDYNSLIFARQNAKEGNHFFVSNIRIAVGAPDTRHKLLEEGKFATTGIYFNSGSSVIKPESCGVLKEIAAVLKENPTVKIKIVGHTDTDGGQDLNLKLSKDRAASVKQFLAAEFGIEETRLESDGKGASEPVGDNAKSEGKAANRRVEFIKM